MRLLCPLLALLSLCACTTLREARTAPPDDGNAVRVRDDDSLVFAVATPVAAPADKVWALLTDRAGWTSWNSTIASLDGTIAAGEKVTLVTKDQQSFTLKVSELVPPQKMVWEDGMPFGLFAGVRTYRLQPRDDGTTLFVMSEVFSGPMLGSIEGSLPDMRPTFTTFAADLKKRAESDAAPPANATP